MMGSFCRQPLIVITYLACIYLHAVTGKLLIAMANFHGALLMTFLETILFVEQTSIENLQLFNCSTSYYCPKSLIKFKS